jgi:hypothetical protein
MEHPETVIASAAKQSIVPREERMDCFASLAMTAIPDTRPPSRREAPEALINISALERAWGTPDALGTRGLVCTW